MVNTLGLFSDNEELEEVATADIRLVQGFMYLKLFTCLTLNLTLYVLNFSERTETYFYILCHIFTLIRRR